MIKDLAQASGLSAATVDRALNGRAHVRQVALDQVLEAAERIGHPTRVLAGRADAAKRHFVRFGFVLHKDGQAFYQIFARELQAAVAARG